ncbi:GAF domain-containing protein [Amycolatopsis sp. NPDC059021]|uniref:GAF domain-containing protein n=1 Tax=Amycolatopsis sp. NPDC059021 TaxID=3346704 RepID=UPI00366C1D9B
MPEPDELDRAFARLSEHAAQAREAVRRWQQYQIAAELAATERRIIPLTASHDQARYPRLDYLDPYFLATTSKPRLLTALLTTALQHTDAEAGNVQLAGADGLRIVTQYGFTPSFLEFFAVVGTSGSACASALTRAQAVTVPDVTQSPLFDDRSRAVMLAANARTVRSIPLPDPATGAVLGVLSVHHHGKDGLATADTTLLTVLARATGRALRWHSMTGNGLRNA